MISYFISTYLAESLTFFVTDPVGLHRMHLRLKRQKTMSSGPEVNPLKQRDIEFYLQM